MWEKLGLLIQPDSSLSWCQTHCMVPTPLKLDRNIFKVFFSGRDRQNRSHIGYATLDLNDDPRIIDYSRDAVLSPGRLGSFDDNGVTPSCIFPLSDGNIALYYIGWNPGSTVRMHLYGGLAISKDGGDTFVRWSEAPILERTRTDPFLNTAPWVVRGPDGLRMFYVSGYEWIDKDLPRYHIKTATSRDGYSWDRDGSICIDFKDSLESALARPFVIHENGKWRMWFSAKSIQTQYSIYYAESSNGKDWIRAGNELKPSKNPGCFDSKMVEYGVIVKGAKGAYMLYNGNNYGAEGIGLAIKR